MANPRELIDKVILYYDDVGSDDAENTVRRARLLLFLQHIYELVWNYREWEWTFDEQIIPFTGEDSLSISGFLPLFLELGRNGGVYAPGGVRMRERPRSVGSRLKLQSGSGSSSPWAGFGGPSFSIWGGSFRFSSLITGDVSFFYRRMAETLVDGGMDDEENEIEMLIPDRYADTVLLPGLIYRAQESKRDSRENWKAQFKEGLAQMCMLENPNKTVNRRMPLAIRGAW